MMHPNTTREVLIVEALGEAATLIRQVEALAPAMNQTLQAILRADTHLRDTLAGFESRMAAITENAKTRTVQHLAARADEATRHAIAQQSRAMADAARLAVGAELGATLHRLQSDLTALMARPARRWECWLTHLAAAGVASALTWVVALRLGLG